LIFSIEKNSAMSKLISNKGTLPEHSPGSSVRNAFDFRSVLITITDGILWDADTGTDKLKAPKTVCLSGTSNFLFPPCWWIKCKGGTFQKEPAGQFSNDEYFQKKNHQRITNFLDKLKEQGGELVTVDGLSFKTKDGYQLYFDGHNCGVDVVIFPTTPPVSP
jgi:hypothetical protein